MVCFQYLRLVREMEGYGSVVFPNCVCDSRKDGHVIPIVGFNSFKLQACTEDGTKEVESLLLHKFYLDSPRP
jgi:sorting nexin-27